MSQYDAIGTLYASMEDLPARAVENVSIKRVLGDVRGLKCLDLACGLGRWSHFLVHEGASHVTGIDLSEGMVKHAKDDLSKLPEAERTKIEYHVADCGEPVAAPGAPFDLAFSVYFLNYAANYQELLGMFKNIYANLKSGGRMVALTINTFVGMDDAFDNKYGVSAEAIARTEEGGWKCRITGYTKPEPIVFENYHYGRAFYEKAATEAGLQEVTWRSHVLPVDDRPDGYWDVFTLRPHFALLTARK